MLFSAIFYTNGGFSIDKAGINLDGLNAYTFPLLLLVICLEFSKVGMVLYRPFLKNKKMFNLSHKLLNILLLMSIMASISFAMINEGNFNIGLKFVNMISEYIPLWIFKKHCVLLVNSSLCVIVEIFIIQLPQFIINLFIDKDLVNESKGYIGRILKIINNLVNYKITQLEKKYNKYEVLHNTITEKSIDNSENIQVIQENNFDEIEHRNKDTKGLELPQKKFRLIHCDANFESKRLNENTDLESVEKSLQDTFETFTLADDVTNDFSNEDLIEYLTYVYNNKNDNISPGQAKISKYTDLSYKKIKAIRYFLEDKKFIEINDKITYLIIDTLHEVLKVLGLEDFENDINKMKSEMEEYKNE